MIGGGITGVLQVPDTHLHQMLSRRYQDLEMLDLMEQNRAKPGGCPSRDREACMRDLLSAWRHAPLHDFARRGWWDNMLANKLDGTEDHLGCGAAAKLWSDLRMDRHRAQAMADVEEEHAAGRLRWRECSDLVGGKSLREAC